MADVLRVRYGGSVKPDNVKGLMALPDVDGALVSGASLKADSLRKLVFLRQAVTARVRPRVSNRL